MIGLFYCFHENAEFDHHFSVCFIALIPKVKILASLNNFRPISLLGWIHKLVARVLSLRPRRVIHHLIRHTKTAFIRGRRIYDGWVIALELLDIMKLNKESILFNLDFENAFVCVSWHFLSFILNKIGFVARWIRWISHCISVAPVSTLVNGLPSPKLVMKCGLWQGCSLSPLLFNLVAESHSNLFY